ncbi:MAG TPA: HD domain-containing protein, partial [Candidatus Saccharimonadales bacterium]
LHDIADWKFHDGDTEIGPRRTTEWLTKLGVEQPIVERVAYIVRHISYRGGTNQHVMETLEGKIVQDADRLDALGAIGIARTFAFGGAHGRSMYEPDQGPQSFDSFQEFKKNMKTGTTINHFYEKLLLLKDGMHTDTAKQIARARHAYMETFLDEFYAEWDGKR